MIKQLFGQLRVPSPVLYQRWKAVVFPSLIIGFMLSTLQPFGIAQMGEVKWPFIGCLTAISASASALFTYLLPVWCPSWFDEQRQTLGRRLLQLFLMLVVIAIGVWGLNCIVAGVWLGILFFLRVLGWVLVLGLFPTAFFLMWSQNLQMKKKLEEQPISSLDDGTANEVERRLCFTGDTRESLEVTVSSLCYAESNGNYVKMVWRDAREVKLQYRLLRLTLKQVEEQVASEPMVVRCHRAFVVNLAHVKQVSGNAQGYRLRLEGVDGEVPVSRAYVKQVKSLLAPRLH